MNHLFQPNPVLDFILSKLFWEKLCTICRYELPDHHPLLEGVSFLFLVFSFSFPHSWKMTFFCTLRLALCVIFISFNFFCFFFFPLLTLSFWVLGNRWMKEKLMILVAIFLQFGAQVSLESHSPPLPALFFLVGNLHLHLCCSCTKIGTCKFNYTCQHLLEWPFRPDC